MAPPHPSRRVSYVIPSPTHPAPRLRLPPLGFQKTGLVGPVLLPLDDGEGGDNVDVHPHPRHRLPVSALALDTSSQLAGSATPEGLLYTGGRDGQIISWELGMPMTKRTRKYGALGRGRAGGRWEAMTGWEDMIDEEDDEDVVMDGDVLGQVKYSGGRRRSLASSGDGVDAIPWEGQWELNPDNLEKPGPDTLAKSTQFRQCIQAHADWVNDIALCNYNQTVVSASSDGSVKAWSPHSTSSLLATTIGTHADYVRCLTQSREQQWVASGSFDRTIKLWDLSRSLVASRSDPIMTLSPPDNATNPNPKSSVYALAADPFGHLIASGSPERVVRTWDPRMGKRVGKLVGHTDNIRAILISEDSRYLLTGSADASIKLWSTASPNRCLHTFTYHTDSVWSLFSQHPSLEIFYSGDRAGTVCKVDVEGCGEIAEGECVVISQDENSGVADSVTNMVAMDDAFLWTAGGGSTVKRWRVPARRMLRAQRAELESFFAQSPSPTFNSPTTNGASLSNDPRSSPIASFRDREHSRSPPPRAHRDSMAPSVLSIASESVFDNDHDNDRSASPVYGLQGPIMPLGGGAGNGTGTPNRPSATATAVDGEAMGLINPVPASSLVRLGDPFESNFVGGGRARDPEVATLYSAASIMSVPRAVGSRGAFRSSPSATGPPGTATSAHPMPVQDAEIASEAHALNDKPDAVIEGENGLVRSVILNDRMHALTVDTVGEVAVWDIIRGTCLGAFGRDDVANASHGGSEHNGSDTKKGARTGERQHHHHLSPREALETVRERVEGEAVVQPWSQADTKIGDLTIHLLDRCFEAEIYADEGGYGVERRFNDELRLNLGKWVLRNLFLAFIREEQRIGTQRLVMDPALPSHLSPPLRSIQRPTAPLHISFEDTSAPSSTSRPRSGSNASINANVALHSGKTPLTPIMTPDIPPSKLLGSPLVTQAIPLGLGTVIEGVALSPIGPSPMQALSLSNDTTPMPMSIQTQGHQRAATDSSITTPLSSSRDTADYFSVRASRSPALPTVPSPGGTTSGTAGTEDDFGAWGGPKSASGEAPQTPITPNVSGSLMGKIRKFGIGRKGATESGVPTTPGGAGAAVDVAEKDTNTPPAKSALEELLAHPLTPPSTTDAPPLTHSTSMALVISEEVSSNWIPVYRGTVASTGSDAQVLEETMPMWLLEYLLFNKTPALAITKISFSLLPMPVKEEGEQLPELVNNSTSKLTASRFLRIRKLIHHVQERIEKISGAPSRPPSGPSSRPSSRPPSRVSSSDQLYGSPHSKNFDLASVVSSNKAEDRYEILCNGVVVPLDMTLAAVRQYIWRQSGELVMHYRRKVLISPTFPPLDQRYWKAQATATQATQVANP